MIRLRNNLIKVISGAAILFWLISVPAPALASSITGITPGNEQVIYDSEAGISQGKTTVNQEETVEEVVTGANEIISEGAADITQSAAVYSDALHGDCPASGTILLAHIGNCWSCTLFDTIFRSINTLATAVYNKLAPSCIELLAVFLGIWLIIQIGRYIGSLAEQNPVEFFEGIIAILCKALIAGALLIQPVSRVTDLLVSPLIVGATEISIAVTQGFTATDKIRPNEKQVADLNRDYAVEQQQIEEKYNLKKKEVYGKFNCSGKCGGGLLKSPLQKKQCDECKANPPSDCGLSNHCVAAIFTLDRDKDNELKALAQDQSDAIIGLLGVSMLPHHCLLMETEPEANEKSALNSQLYNALQCMVGNLHNTTAYGLAMASSILCHSWTAESFGLFPVQFVSLRMLATGVIIWLVCFLLSLLFVFKLIDACFRLGVMLVLLPLLIVAWVFPPTVEFTKKGFQMLIHIMMVFISLAIVLSLALALVEIAFGGNSEVVANGTIVKSAASIKDYFNNNEVYKMANAIDFSFFNFIIAMICCVFAIKILSLVDQAATEFSSVFGVGSDIGDRLGMVSARSAALITQASATLGVAGAKSGGRIANWRANRNIKKSMAAASGGRYQGPGGRSAGGAWTPALAAATDAKTATYAGFDATKFSAISADIALAKKALNADGSYTRRESLQAKLALRNNDNAKQMYKGGADGIRSSEQAYTNAKILRNVYGATAVEKMSQGQREALVYKGEAFGIAAANRTERVEAMNKMDDNGFNKIKRDVELADKVRQGTATTDEESKVYERISNGNEDMKRVLTMSETQFAEYQKALKDSEAQRASP